MILLKACLRILFSNIWIVVAQVRALRLFVFSTLCCVQVRYEEGQAFADGRGVPFIECSAKGNINVGEVFATLLREIERENGMFEEEVSFLFLFFLPPLYNCAVP